MLKTTTLAMLATLAAGAALAQDASPIDDAIAGCAAGVAAPADAGTALEAKGFTKAEADGATTYTNGTVTVTLTTEPAGCAVSDTAMSTAQVAEKLSAMLGGTLPAEAKDANGCRSFDMGSGVKASITGTDATACEADTGGTLRLTAGS